MDRPQIGQLAEPAKVVAKLLRIRHLGPAFLSTDQELNWRLIAGDMIALLSAVQASGPSPAAGLKALNGHPE
jgi:hypothetical protein